MMSWQISTVNLEVMIVKVNFEKVKDMNFIQIHSEHIRDLINLLKNTANEKAVLENARSIYSQGKKEC